MFLRTSSNTNAGEVACDPFSGSTAVAALREGRNFVGTEADEQCFTASKLRVQQLAGKK